jgi:hypothetical protein
MNDTLERAQESVEESKETWVDGYRTALIHYQAGFQPRVT